jgi:cytochrome P450 family 135
VGHPDLAVPALPPGPRRPATLQTFAWVARPLPFLETCRRRYGDWFTVRLARVGTFVFVAAPAAIKEIFTGDAELLRAGQANAPLAPVVGPRSVLLLDGAEHLRQRRLMLPPFHGERMARYGELMAEITEAELDRWSLREPFALRPRTQAITLEIILRVVFGVRDAARLEALRAALVALLAQSTSPATMLPWLRRDLGPLSPWRRFLRLRARVDALIYDEIAHRREDAELEERDDILSLLLQARDGDGETLTDRELRDELVTLLVAGHETTATALAWAFERLLRHPEALERLTAEARDGEEEGAYAEAVVQETLRLRPPLPAVGRMLTEPAQIAGRSLPAGVRLAPSIYLVHRRADLYPEPGAFRPERFLANPPETYGWLPFGGGVRRCLGASFATFEMKIVLRTILARARLEADDARPEPVRRRAIVLAPGREGRAVLIERAPRRAAVAA